MLKNIIFGFGLSTVFFILRFIPLIFHKTKWKSFAQNLDVKNIILEWLFGAITLTVFFSISIYFKDKTNLTMILIGILTASFLISYGFFVYPFLIILRKNKFKVSEYYQNWAKLNINKDITIRILKHDMVNAYATGVLSASKVILLSDKIIEKMDEVDIKNLLYHEYAHLKYNHLFVLYLSNVLCCSLSIISASHFYPIFETAENPGILVAFHGALFGGLYILVPGLVQRKLEYQADYYASSMVGLALYSETLRKLNIATDGGLEKKVINYPTLNERIRNVSIEKN